MTDQLRGRLLEVLNLDLDNSCDRTKFGLAVTLVAGAGIYLIAKKLSATRRAQLQRDWDSAGKDVVVLHQFPRATSCAWPTLSTSMSLTIT